MYLFEPDMSLCITAYFLRSVYMYTLRHEKHLPVNDFHFRADFSFSKKFLHVDI